MKEQINDAIYSEILTLTDKINEQTKYIILNDNLSIKKTFYKWMEVGKMCRQLKGLIKSQGLKWEGWCKENFKGANASRIQEAMKIFLFTLSCDPSEIEYIADLGFDNSLLVQRALDKVPDVARRKIIMEQHVKGSDLFLLDDRFKKLEMAKWLIALADVAVKIDPAIIDINMVHDAIIANGEITEKSIKIIIELAAQPEALKKYLHMLIINGTDENNAIDNKIRMSIDRAIAIYNETLKTYSNQSTPINDFILDKIRETKAVTEQFIEEQLSKIQLSETEEAINAA
jgi:hypothetical protein